MNRIQDRFANLKVSRQYRYQLRHQAEGLCRLCSRRRINKTHCAIHAANARDYQAKKFGRKRIYKNCKSRQAEQ